MAGHDGLYLNLVDRAGRAPRGLPHRAAGSCPHPRRGARVRHPAHRLRLGDGARQPTTSDWWVHRGLARGDRPHQGVRHSLHDLLSDELHGDAAAAAHDGRRVRAARQGAHTPIIGSRGATSAARWRALPAPAGRQPRVRDPGAGADDLRGGRLPLRAGAPRAAARRQAAAGADPLRRALLAVASTTTRASCGRCSTTTRRSRPPRPGTSLAGPRRPSRSSPGCDPSLAEGRVLPPEPLCRNSWMFLRRWRLSRRIRSVRGVNAARNRLKEISFFRSRIALAVRCGRRIIAPHIYFLRVSRVSRNTISCAFAELCAFGLQHASSARGRHRAPNFGDRAPN